MDGNGSQGWGVPTAPQHGPDGVVVVEPQRGAWLFRRRSWRLRLGLMAVGLTVTLLTGVVGILTTLDGVRHSAAEAEDALADVTWPTVRPAPATPTAPRASDGVYGIEGYTVLAGEPVLAGAPGAGWVADGAADLPDDALWRSGGCTLSAWQRPLATFGAVPPDVSDGSWSLEGLGMQEQALGDVAAVTPRGADLTLRLPTSDGHALEVVGRVLDAAPTPADPGFEGVVAARALGQHEVLEEFVLLCPAGALTDPAGTMQAALDGFVVQVG